MERDADGQHDVRIGDVPGQVQPAEHRVGVRHHEVGVLEEAEEAEVADQTEDEPELGALAPLHVDHDQPVDEGRGEQQQEVNRVPPGVEEVRGGEQPVDAEARAPRRDIDRIHEQEKDNERPRVEKHPPVFLAPRQHPLEAALVRQHRGCPQGLRNKITIETRNGL